MRQNSILPGRVQPSTLSAIGLNFCVRYENRWTPITKSPQWYLLQLSSVVIGLCSVFFYGHQIQRSNIFSNLRNIDNCILYNPCLSMSPLCFSYSRLVNYSWTSARPISINQLNVLLHLHPWPINLVVYKGPYQKDILSLGGFHT